jgi:hypothetical protein
MKDEVPAFLSHDSRLAVSSRKGLEPFSGVRKRAENNSAPVS